MRTQWIIAVIILSLFMERSYGDIPTSLHKCRYGDLTCIAESIQYVLTNYAKTGIKEMNLVPFDPMKITTLKLKRDQQSSVSVEVVFKDIQVLGLSHAKVKRLKGFTKDISQSDEIEFECPKITLKGPYSVNGNVLILPIVGKGNAEIVLENVVYIIKTKNKSYQKDGKTYLNHDDLTLDIRPKRVYMKLDGLFNGNKELEDTMNRFLNENWKEIFSEMHPAVSEAFSLITKHMLVNVFSKYPYEHFFDNS